MHPCTACVYEFIGRRVKASDHSTQCMKPWLRTRKYVVEIAEDGRLPESRREVEARSRLMAVNGVKSVKSVS
jgi:hypothetical protein